jgi:beta-glucanase (GH16 family)
MSIAKAFSLPATTLCVLRRLTAIVALALLFGAGCPTQAQEVPALAGWDLVWHDEFSGTSLNTTYWEAANRRNSHNNEKQFYHPNQVAVADGNLKLTAINTPRDGKAYQSGLVTSKELFGPGRFEARMDLPTSQGMWPAFWLNANNVQWPLGGEIDILENRGSQPNLVSSAYHWQKDPGPCCDDHRFEYHEHTAEVNGQPVNYHDGFHTYAVEWDEETLKFFVDDVLHYTLTETADRPIIETSKNIILNLAVGGDFGGDPNGSTVWPQTLQVDYVRYWRPATQAMSGDYNLDGLVDAADYTLWRNNVGRTGTRLSADGNGDQVVDHLDYTIWAATYGQVTTATSSGAGVPEPQSVAMTIGAAIISRFLTPMRLPAGM